LSGTSSDLAESLGALGCARDQIARLVRFRDDVLRFNRGQNLTTRVDPGGRVDALLLECVGVVRSLPRPEGPVLDLGSGAGFPGIPCAILDPGEETVLLERRGGRCGFLRREVRALGLTECSVLEQDAASVRERDRGRFRRVFLKAVAPPGEALRLARPYLQAAGCAVLFRAASWSPGDAEREDWDYRGPHPAGPVPGRAEPPVVHIFSRP